MSVKSAKLRASLVKSLLSLFLAMFGVCSVSAEAFSYTASFSRANSSTESIRYTRSAREIPKQNQKPIRAESEPVESPFAPGTHNLSIGVGEDFLFGSLGNTYDNAIGPEIHYAYGVSDLFAFESNFGYHSHSRGSDSVSIWNLAAGLRTNLIYFDQLVPFLNVDLGFFHPSFSYAGGGSASSLLFGLQLGGGVDLLLSRSMFFGAALNYNDMFDSTKTDSNGVSRGLGGSYVSFMVHIGYSFN
jgi:hypothetical protein